MYIKKQIKTFRLSNLPEGYFFKFVYTTNYCIKCKIDSIFVKKENKDKTKYFSCYRCTNTEFLELDYTVITVLTIDI